MPTKIAQNQVAVGAVSQIAVAVNAGTTLSLTSTSYADLPTNPLSVTLTTLANSTVLIFLSVATMKPGAASQDLYLQIVIDGVGMGDQGTIFSRGTGTTDYKPGSLIAIKTNLTAGSHTIKVQYKVSGGTAEINSGVAGSQLMVLELKR